MKVCIISIASFIKNILQWKSLFKALGDFSVIFTFTTLATLSTIFSMLVKYNKIVDWPSLYNDGNFFLYSISFLSSTYIYYQHKHGKSIYKSILLVLLALSSLCSTQFINHQKSATDFTLYGSISILIISSVFFITAQYNQHILIPDLNREDTNNQDAIASGVTY